MACTSPLASLQRHLPSPSSFHDASGRSLWSRAAAASAPGARCRPAQCSRPACIRELLPKHTSPATARGAPAWGAALGTPSPSRSRHASTVAMGLRAVESFDTSFELSAEAEETLVFLLSSDAFRHQVAEQPGVPDSCSVEFTGKLFPPVPWSPTTKHGMPPEFEQFLHDKENFVIINVPPNFMFKAQIFKPSRLCAIYQIKHGVVPLE